MLPVLFTIGPFKVYAFGFFLSLSFILSTFIIWRYAKEDLKEAEYLDAFLYTSVVALIAARIVYILFHFEEFGINILRYIVVRETPGLSLTGGLIGGFLFLWWYARAQKFDFLHLLDLFSLAASLALIFAKIGEQLAGSGFGRETIFFLAVKVIGLSGRRHPVEFYEAVAFFLLAIILSIVYNKIRHHRLPAGLAFCLFTLVIAVSIFLLEFLQVNSVYLYGLSLNQFIALLLLIIIIKPFFIRLKMLNSIRREK